MSAELDDDDVKAIGEALADAILSVDTDVRGKMLMYAGRRLKLNGQGYTGSLFLQIAEQYGYEE